MNNRLTPTQVVDVNGRVTTVHKKQDSSHGARKQLQAPAPSVAPEKRPAVSTRTPLIYPDPITVDEILEFEKKYRTVLSQPGYDSKAFSIFSVQMDKGTQALVKRVLDNGTVSPGAVARMITNYGNNLYNGFVGYDNRNEKADGHLRAALLIGERLHSTYPDAIPEEGLSLGESVGKATKGYAFRARIADRVKFTALETEEELAAITGVTAFMLYCEKEYGYSGGFFKNDAFPDSVGNSQQGTYIVNRSLDAFLREHPDKARHAAKYALERDWGNTVKHTRALIEFVNDTEENGVLNEGWL